MDRQNKFFDVNELRKYAKQMIDMVCDLYEQQTQESVAPNIQPGDVRKQLAQRIPEQGESFEKLLEDTRQIIFQNMIRYQHPKQFGLACAVSHASVIAEIFQTSFCQPGLTWQSCPAGTELETHVVDLTVDLLRLPQYFKFSQTGGGQICNTISEGILLSIHASKHQKIKELKLTVDDPIINKFSVYITSTTFYYEKPFKLKDIQHIRRIPAIYSEEQNDFVVDPQAYEEAILKDIQDGFIPFFCGLCLGSTSSCSVDPIDKITAICKKYGVYVCVDAAYQGAAQVCEEFQYLSDMLQDIDYYQVKFCKYLLAGTTGTFFWVKNRHEFLETLTDTPDYLKNAENKEIEVVNYMNWGVGSTHPLYALKLWFVLNRLGVEGIKEQIRDNVNKAQYFEKLVKLDNRFQVIGTVKSGMVNFRFYQTNLNLDTLNQINKILYQQIKENTHEGYILQSYQCGLSFMRLVVNNPNTLYSDLDSFWKYCQNCFGVIQVDEIISNTQKLIEQ